MMYRFASLAFLFLVIGSCLHAQELPAAPDGYSWARLNGMKAAVLVPERWYLKQETTDNGYAFFVSREEIVGDGIFKVGLSVNVVTKIKGVMAADLAQQYNKRLTSEQKTFETIEIKNPTLAGNAFIFEHEGLRMCAFACANRTTNTFYLIMFEAPSDEWGKQWEVGKRILDALVADPAL